MPYFCCDFCTTSFCKPCAVKWGEKQGGKHQYIEIALLSEYCGDDPNPTAPNTESVRIICDICIGMGKACIARGGVTANMARLFNSNVKSFDPKSKLFGMANPSGGKFPTTPTGITGISPNSSSRTVGAFRSPKLLQSRKQERAGAAAVPWKEEDLEYFTNYLKVFQPSASAPITQILQDAALRERLSEHDEFSISHMFKEIVNSQSHQLGHLNSDKSSVSMRFGAEEKVTDPSAVSAALKY
jgi:hypothetical protein